MLLSLSSVLSIVLYNFSNLLKKLKNNSLLFYFKLDTYLLLKHTQIYLPNATLILFLSFLLSCFLYWFYNFILFRAASGKQIVSVLLSQWLFITYNCLYYFINVFFMVIYKFYFRFLDIRRYIRNYYKFIMILYPLLWYSYSFITLLI